MYLYPKQFSTSHISISVVTGLSYQAYLKKQLVGNENVIFSQHQWVCRSYRQTHSNTKSLTTNSLKHTAWKCKRQTQILNNSNRLSWQNDIQWMYKHECNRSWMNTRSHSDLSIISYNNVTGLKFTDCRNETTCAEYTHELY